MIGDGVCQSECNSEACEWDGLDCGCAANCNISDYGTCKEACLVPDCGYDALPGFPKCTDEQVRVSFKAIQGYFQSFSVKYSYESFCKPSVPICSFALWKSSFQICVPECATAISCLSSFSSCEPDCSAFPHCSSCTPNFCLKCAPGFASFFLHCMPACPVSFHLHSLDPSLCTPSSDSSTTEKPQLYYVGSDADGGNRGSAEEPFTSLAFALAAVHNRYTRIYLLNSVHLLNVTTPSRYARRIETDLSFERIPGGEDAIVEVRPLYCSEMDHKACILAGTVTVQCVNMEPIAITLRGTFLFQGIQFDGSAPLVTNCQGELCSYCPHVDTNGDKFFDDRNAVVEKTAFADISACKRFHSNSFLHVEIDTNVTFTNCSFVGFRQQYQSLILVTKGNLRLENVSFDTVQAKIAVILQIGAALRSNITIENSVVKLLNNGFEYAAGDTYAGFLSVESAESVVISEVNFQYNLLGAAGVMLAVQNVMSFRILHCSFFRNFGRIISVEFSVQLPLELSEDNEPRYYSMVHIVVSDSSFTYNSGNSLISVLFNDEVQNIEVKNCYFEENLSQTSGLVNLKSSSELTKREIEGKTSSVLTSTSRVSVYFPKATIRFSGIAFKLCSVFGDGLISIENLPNVEIADLSVWRCGDANPLHNFYEVTLEAFITLKEAYMSQPVLGLETQHCRSLIYLNNLAGLAVHESSFVANTCENGSAGLMGVNLRLNISFVSLAFEGNSNGVSAFGSVIDMNLLGSATFSNCSIWNNTSIVSGTMKVSSGTYPISIFDSVLAKNSNGGALICSGTCVVRRTVFEGNFASGKSGAGMVYSPLPKSSLCTIEEVTFSNNYAVVAGAFMIVDTLQTQEKIALFIEHSNFVSNISPGFCSCLYIDSSVSLKHSGSVSKSVFTQNFAAFSSIFTSFLTGGLTFDDCEFSRNSADKYTVLQSTSPSMESPPSIITFQNSRFDHNSGAALIVFMFFNGLGVSKNLTFTNNCATGVYIEMLHWSESGSRFYNNSCDRYISGFVISYLSAVNIVNTTFEENRNTETGAAVAMSDLSVVSFKNCYFIGNSAAKLGGAVYVSQQSSVLFESCYFVRNKATDEGSAIYFLVGSLSIPQVVSNCTFIDNEAHSGTISVITANVTIIGCHMLENRAKVTPGVIIHLSEVTIVDSQFDSQQGTTGVFVSAPASSTVRIYSSSFWLGEAVERGAAVYVSSSVLEIVESEFSALRSKLGTAVSVYSDSTFLIRETKFSNISTSATGGGIIYLSESTGYISDCFFSDFNNGAVVGVSVYLTINSSEFHDGTSFEGAAVSCRDCSSVTIADSVCRNLSAQSAACYSLRNAVGLTPFLIQSCEIESNRGKTNGAVFIENADIVISGSQFVNNTAEDHNATAVAGALLLSCPLKSYCNSAIDDTKFIGNRATHNGGAVCWTHFQPILTEVEFKNNSAFYGNDIASFAVKIAVLSRYELTNFPSGQLAPDIISVALFDHYGTIVTADSSSVADLLPVDSANMTITGVARVVAVSGVFNFSAYGIIAKPGEKTKIKIRTSGVDLTKSGSSTNMLSELIINVSMRNCIVGESLFENLCYVCPEGKYSLDPSQSCSECPTGAICLGRAIMIPQPGYWRSLPTSNKFWKCPNADACLGSSTDLSQISLLGDCAEGYYGNMCNGCIGGFSRSTKGKCSQCPEQTMNIVQIVGIGVCTLLVLIFVIKMSLVSARKSSSQLSIYLKIFVNYLQLVSLTAGFDLSWPTYLIGVFTIQESAGNVGEQVFSFDCFIAYDEIDTQQNVMFLKVIVVSCLPLLILSVSVLFWGIISVCKKSRFYMKHHLVNSLTVLFFIAHPSIVKVMFDVFNCKEIDPGEFWMSSYLNIRCWNAEHERYALGIALPSVILWGVATPLIVLLLLIAYHKRLEDLPTRIRFGFLFAGYQLRNYFWEFVILYRKMIIIILSVFFTTISVPVQALCVMIVLIFAFLLQMKQRPFLNPTHNELEQRGILVASITIYCGLFFLTGEIEGPSQFVLFIIILIANVYFLLYWLVQTCKACVICIIRLILRLKGVVSHLPQRVIPVRRSLNMSSQPLAGYVFSNRSASKVIDMQYEESNADPELQRVRRVPEARNNTPIDDSDDPRKEEADDKQEKVVMENSSISG